MVYILLLCQKLLLLYQTIHYLLFLHGSLLLNKSDFPKWLIIMLALFDITIHTFASCKAFFNSRSLVEGEAATRGVLCKKVFLEISQNSQENTCARVSFLINLQASGLQLY